MQAEIPVDTPPPDGKDRVLRGPARRFGAVALIAIIAAGCYLAIPAATFRTHAILLIDGGSAPLRSTLVRVAADTAVSKPVIDRAAATLLAADAKAPVPDLVERLGVAAGVNSATSRQARVADALVAVTRADPGVVTGTLEISVASPGAEQAARIADAVADAFVIQQDDAATQARIRYEDQAAARMDGTKAASLSARQRLIALCGASLDPVQARNAAAAQTATAETRLASIRAIMSSGSPPVSDRKDLPPALAVPQSAYLDLKAQLAKQGETLGERHTTIIALREGVKRAAATLSSEWNRLKRIAEADVVAARESEAALAKSDAPADAKRRDAIEDARRAVQAADDAVTLARTQQDAAPDEATFRLIARAPVPQLATGFSLSARLTLSLLAGLAVFAALRALAVRRGARATSIRPAVSADDPAKSEATSPPPPQPVMAPSDFFDEDVLQPLPVWLPPPAPVRPRADRPAPSLVPDRVDTDLVDTDLVDADLVDADLVDADLVDAMRAVLDGIETREPGGSVCPTVMIAAIEGGLATTPVALALGRAASERRWRVLLVEADRVVPRLAAAAAMEAEPVLIDFYGSLRVGLPADGTPSLVVAPVLRDAARLASNLARSGTTALIDDLASAFDLIVVDGGVAADAAAAGWTADAFVRVASRASRHDDEAFCATFEVAGAARLATILPSAIAAERVAVPAPRVVPRSIAPRTVPLRPRTQPAPVAASASFVQQAPRRKIAAR